MIAVYGRVQNRLDLLLQRLNKPGTHVLLLVLLVAGIGYWAVPKPDLFGHLDFSKAIYDRNGELLRLTLAGDERYRLWAPLRAIDDDLQKATLLYEDRYFRYHPGVNAVALIKAFYASFIQRERIIGASTITMQLARLRYRLNTRDITGKIVQILRALQIERHYSKDEILQAYLNLAPYGFNIEGVAAASLIYFGKPVSDLSLPEALLLAVIPQNPAGRNPAITKNSGETIAARARLFQMWLAEYPEDQKLASGMRLPIQVRQPAKLPFSAPHFVDRILQQHPYLSEGDYRTTLDNSIQHLLERHAQDYVQRHRNEGIHNASALLLNYQTHEVIAEMGSVDFYADDISGQVNGTLARRSPGSALKPFIYALALDHGLIHPLSLLKDAPKRFAAYTPENFDQKFIGPVSATDALILSRNVPAVKLMFDLPGPGFHGFLREAGISNLNTAEHYGLALALGGNEVSMHELVNLYAMLANLGRYRQGSSLLSIEQPQDIQRKNLLSPEAAYLTLSMLQKNPPVDGIELQQNYRYPYPVYWKTGTSFAFRDAWAVGIVGPYVLAVWVGNFDGSSNPAFIGRRAAGPLFFELARALAARHGDFERYEIFKPGLHITEVDVCAGTGGLPNRDCPRTEQTLFIPGKSPIEISTIHRRIDIDNKTGLRACRSDPKTTRREVYEFWPSDLHILLKQAGISVRRAPPYMPGCSLDITSAGGKAPEITSPDRALIYNVSAAGMKQESIPFSAVADADAKVLYWFIDDRFLGQAGANEPYFWKADPGRFTVRVVDNLGRSDSMPVKVNLIQ